MKEKELRRMSRADLLKLLIEETEENERLRTKVSRLVAMLEDRHIKLQEAGSIAKAALELNKVFEAAEAAAAQYVESLRHLAEDREDAEAEDERTTSVEETEPEISDQAEC